MRNTKVLGRAKYEYKSLHQSQAAFSLALALSQVPPQVCQDTNRTAELNLRSGLEQTSLFGRALCLAESPIAAEQEYLTIKSLRTHVLDAELLRSFRYADNRCFFLRRSELQTDWAKLLFQLDFYGLPIELEYVPGEQLLGSITSTQQGTITMQQPANETVLRSVCSAGSRSAALSGFSARAVSIRRHTRPIRLVRPQVEDLIEICRPRGFNSQEHLQLSKRFQA